MSALQWACIDTGRWDEALAASREAAERRPGRVVDKGRRPHAAAGQRFVAAPVFGRPEAAAAGQLFVVAAGEPGTVAAVGPIFDAVGQRTFVVSDVPKAANLVKLSGNFLIASVIESLGEAMALVGKGGVDLRQYLDILTSTLYTG